MIIWTYFKGFFSKIFQKNLDLYQNEGSRFKTDEQLRQFSRIFFNKLKKEITINEL